MHERCFSYLWPAVSRAPKREHYEPGSLTNAFLRGHKSSGVCIVTVRLRVHRSTARRRYFTHVSCSGRPLQQQRNHLKFAVIVAVLRCRCSLDVRQSDCSHKMYTDYNYIKNQPNIPNFTCTNVAFATCRKQSVGYQKMRALRAWEPY